MKVPKKYKGLMSAVAEVKKKADAIYAQGTPLEAEGHDEDQHFVAYISDVAHDLAKMISMAESFDEVSDGSTFRHMELFRTVERFLNFQRIQELIDKGELRVTDVSVDGKAIELNDQGLKFGTPGFIPDAL